MAMNAGATTERLSDDGKLLLGLLILILVGPYLPHFGPIRGRIRIDNLLLPAMAGGFVLRGLFDRRVVLGRPAALYGMFLLWLLSVTVVFSVLPPSGRRPPTSTTLLAGLDAYVRPFLLLVVTANARLRPADVRVMVRAILLMALPLFLIGVLQLLPVIAGPLNGAILLLYDNGRQTIGGTSLIQLVLAGGRTMSIFGQVGTFAMFSLLCLGLLAAHPLGAEFVRSALYRRILLVFALLGGVVSGSKLFTGGAVLFAMLLLGFSRFRALLTRPKLLAAGATAAGAAFLVLARLKEVVLEGLFARLDPSLLWQIYLESRFGSLGDAAGGKLARTGALDLLAEYPVTGLGLTVVGDTTDSFILGILIMGGTVGAAIFALFIAGVLGQLWRTAEETPSQALEALARVLALLTLTFLVAAIGFHTFIQDRSGDAYWLLIGAVLSPSVQTALRAPRQHSRLARPEGSHAVPTTTAAAVR